MTAFWLLLALGVSPEPKVPTVTASSTMKASGGYRFDPAQLVDGKLNTSWQPAAAGVGQWVLLTFEGELEVHGLAIANGFQVTDKLGDEFANNSRASRVTLQFSDGSTESFTLDPWARGLTTLRFRPRSTHTLKLTVDSLAKGNKWKDLALSELKVLDAKAATADDAASACVAVFTEQDREAQENACVLTRACIGAKDERLATLDGPCRRLTVNWSADFKRLLVTRRDPAGMAPAVTLVSLGDGKVRDLQLPEQGVVEQVGFNAQGEVLALTSGAFDQGTRQRPQEPGEPSAVAARAFKLGPKGWTRTEMAASTVDDIYGGKATSALNAENDLVRPPSVAEPTFEETTPAEVAMILKQGLPEPGQRDEWSKLTTARGTLFVLRSPGDLMHCMDHLAVLEGDHVVALPSQPPDPRGFRRQIALTLRGALLLVADEHDDLESTAQFIDLQQHTVVRAWTHALVLPWAH